MGGRVVSSGGSPLREALSIGALSRATRIPVETIRTWEQRYRSPVAMRKPSGHRVYSAGTVEQLRRVTRLLARGHRPGELLRLSVAELDRLISVLDAAAPVSGSPLGAASPDVGGTAQRLQRMRHAMLELDRPSLQHELQAGWAQLGPVVCLEELGGAFLVEVGRAWEAGEAEVRHEHFAFACVSDFLRSVREPYDQQASGPRVVVGALPGERHEGGLALVSVLLAVRGYRVVYLGLDTPVDQLAEAAANARAEAVVVSVSVATARLRAGRDLAALRKALPRRLPLWLGGAGAPAAMQGVERFGTLRELDERLGSLTT